MPIHRNPEIVPQEEIKFVFNTASLHPGDILLMNTYHESQRERMERACGSCIYDHTAIYLGDAYLMEANGLGVVMNHIFSRGFKNEGDACVMRMKQISPVLIEHIVYNARTFMGMGFRGDEAETVPKYKDTNQEDTSNRTFCSRMVAQCYNQAGIKLFPNPAYCSPDDFLSCDQLYKVDNPLQPFTSEMERTVMSRQVERDTFENATFWSKKLKDFSKLYGEDVQTPSQLLAVAARHTDKDEEALKLISSNKLYQPVEDRKTNTPWIDNDDDFFNHFVSTGDQLFFLRNQMCHYDKTYIPDFKGNVASLCGMASLCPQSKVIERVKQGCIDELAEAEYIRERLAHLYKEVEKRDKQGFSTFVEQYGEYENVEYVKTPIDLSNVLYDMMRASFFSGK